MMIVIWRALQLHRMLVGAMSPGNV